MTRCLARDRYTTEAPSRGTVWASPFACATPGWSLRRRSQVLALTLSLLLLTQFLSFLITIEYTKLWPTQTAVG